ncbi:hypothetical protein DTO166G4_4222 [Paecilomyces variotii]|nr:hypothetical protein DTO166G4_4222 [Paecilomyces variotii]
MSQGQVMINYDDAASDILLYYIRVRHKRASSGASPLKEWGEVSYSRGFTYCSLVVCYPLCLTRGLA